MSTRQAPETESSHVRIRDVHKRFLVGGDELKVLNGIDLDVSRGEFLCLLGPSGCGKSTLLRLIGGLIEPTSGSITLGGKSPAEAQEAKSLGFVFQDPSLLPWRTVKRNIRLSSEVNRSGDTDSDHSIDDLLTLVGLENYADYYPFQLSGGMQQRVALARALAVRASVLLMDEPFGALDEITRAAMRYELLRIWDADHKTVLFVTHSISEAVALSDRVAVLSRRPGRIAGVVEVDLPRPRSEDMEREPEFLECAGLLRDLLVYSVGGSSVDV
jgi:NitT/TauT family transport system ATP-binding protein